VRITLVSIHPSPSAQAVPLANAFLKSYAADIPVGIELADLFSGQESTGCAESITGMRPKAVGFSMYLWNREACLEIAADLRRRMPEIILFAGGPEVTADPSGVLSDSTLDFAILGEGEKPFRTFCEHLAAGKDIPDIPGIIRPGTDVPAVPPTPLDDLDAIPSPYLNGTLNCETYPGILWQLSRGCGFSCDFCFDSRDRHGVRRFSLERIEAELRHFADCGVSQVFVLDSTFNQDLKRAKAILRLIGRIAPGIHFHFEVRSEFIDPQLAELFARITCSLQIGLQSSDSLVLKGVGRAFRPEDFTERVNLLNESGAVFGFDLIFGLPGDTLQGLRASLDFALGLYPNHLDIFPLAVLPGTALALRSQAIGLRHLTRPPYTLLASPTFNAADMSTAQRLATACDIFYTRGKAVAWFNGVIQALGLRPSAFLQRFSEWLVTEKGKTISESDLDDHEVWQLQRAFLKVMFGSKSHKRLLPLVLDLTDYHYHYAVVLMTPPERTAIHLPDTAELLETPLRLAVSARLVEFHYEILDILEAGEPDIHRLADSLLPCESFAVIYPGPEGVCTESLAEPYFRLLERLDGRTLPGRIGTELAIPAEEARELLAFALSEGIVLPV
jgi:hypothetical protein